MIGDACYCGSETLCSWEILWRGHLKRVLSLFCDSEMSLYDRLLLHKIESNDHFLAKYVLELCSAHLQLPSCPVSPTATVQVDWGQKRNCLVQKLPSTKKMQKSLKCGSILLAVDWWQMPHFVSRLEWKFHHSLSSFKTFSNCLKSPSPANFPLPAPQN